MTTQRDLNNCIDTLRTTKVGSHWGHAKEVSSDDVYRFAEVMNDYVS